MLEKKCKQGGFYKSEDYHCSEDSPKMFVCTRKDGHKGKHHAHDECGNCYEIW